MDDSIEEKFLKKNPTVEPSELNWTGDGRLEWVCEHGIGHTVYAPEDLDLVHGCDGCCEDIIILK